MKGNVKKTAVKSQEKPTVSSNHQPAKKAAKGKSRGRAKAPVRRRESRGSDFAEMVKLGRAESIPASVTNVACKTAKTGNGAGTKVAPKAKKVKSAKAEATDSGVVQVEAAAPKSEGGLSTASRKPPALPQTKTAHQLQPGQTPGPTVAGTPAPKPTKLRPGVKLFNNGPGVPPEKSAAATDPEIDFGSVTPPGDPPRGDQDGECEGRSSGASPPLSSEAFAAPEGYEPELSASGPGQTDQQQEMVAVMDESSNNRITHHLGARFGPHEPRAGNGDSGPVTPGIEREPPEDEIRVGAGGTLIVPREDIDSDIDDGSELDLAGMIAQKIRKPGRREWIALNPASELPTRMLLHKPKADGIEVEHFYVAPSLRGPIREDLKDVRVFVYYSYTTKAHALWIVNVTLENSWYESLVPLFQQSAEFFAEHAIRVISDKGNSRYRVKYKPLPARVAWPAKTTEQLLGEAIGASRFITSPDHPIYQDLVEGTELG